MEYCANGDVFNWLSTQAGMCMDENTARNCLAQVLSGVQHFHERGLAHLDISWENVLLTAQGYLKLCDFGQARDVKRDPATRAEVQEQRGVGTSVGTKENFRSPELRYVQVFFSKNNHSE